MPLHRETIRQQGNWLFRWRSFLPLVLVPLALLACRESGSFDNTVGPVIDGLWEVGCLVIAFIGLAIRVAVSGTAPEGTSGRNTHRQRATVLNTTGLYSMVRNPLYLGNMLIALGIFMIPGTWWLIALVAVGMVLYYERIIYAEEAFLETQFGNAYHAWADRTPMLIPNPSLYRRASTPFCVRTALRREYSGLYAIVAGTTAIELASDLIGEGENFVWWLHHEDAWVAYFITGTIIYLTLRTLKRHTTLLRPA